MSEDTGQSEPVSAASACYDALRSAVGELITECERRIDHLYADNLIDKEKQKILTTENRRFILWLQAMTQCACPELNGIRVTGSSCPVHGLKSIPWD